MIDKKAIPTWVAFYIGKIEMFPGDIIMSLRTQFVLKDKFCDKDNIYT
jgi:hypothetical protein